MPRVLAPSLAVSAIVAVAVAATFLRAGDDTLTVSPTSDGSAEVATSGAGTDAASPTGSADKITRDSAGGAAQRFQLQRAARAAVPPLPPSGGGSPRSDARRERKVERSATLALQTTPDKVDDVSSRIMAVADRLGGFVVSSSVNTTDDGGGGNFLLRVPTAKLQEALTELSALAHVRGRTQQAEDITAPFVSARSRLQQAQAERRSLLRRLELATTDAQVEALKAQLGSVDRRIALARRALARVNNRAAYANVSVTLTASGKAGAGAGGGAGHWTPGDAARDALRVLEVAAGVLLVGLAAGIPLALVIAAGVAAARWSTRRARERALDAV
jgi:hypothetical protein